jgi:hypothetical protein
MNFNAMSDTFQYDVFLSHSSKDKAVVRPLAERLRTRVAMSRSERWALDTSSPARRRRQYH